MEHEQFPAEKRIGETARKTGNKMCGVKRLSLAREIIPRLYMQQMSDVFFFILLQYIGARWPLLITNGFLQQLSLENVAVYFLKQIHIVHKGIPLLLITKLSFIFVF